MMKFLDAKGVSIFLTIGAENVINIKPCDVEGCSCITYYENGKVTWIAVKGTTEEVHARFFGNTEEPKVGDRNNSAYWKEKYNTLLLQGEEVSQQLKVQQETNSKLTFDNGALVHQKESQSLRIHELLHDVESYKRCIKNQEKEISDLKQQVAQSEKKLKSAVYEYGKADLDNNDLHDELSRLGSMVVAMDAVLKKHGIVFIAL